MVEVQKKRLFQTILRKNIFRLKEELEEPLNPSLKRAYDKAKQILKIEGARDIMPAPAKFLLLNQDLIKKVYKRIRKSGIELDKDFEKLFAVWRYLKDVSGKTFQNLFISPRLII